jgi:serine protease inhibitor
MPLPLVLAMSLTVSSASPPFVATRRSEPQVAAAPAESVAVAATNRLGVDLFRTMAETTPNGNLFLSPLSIAMALAMTAEGSAGETEREMATILHVPDAATGSARPITSLHAGFAALMKSLADAAGAGDAASRARIADLRAKLDEANAKVRTLDRADGAYRDAMAAQREAQRLAEELNALVASVDRFDLRLANALWVERTYPLAPQYVATLAQHYGSGAAASLDIAGDVEGARTRINDWVASRTEDRIRDLLPSGMLTPLTRLVITNAIFFKGEWSVPFAESDTRLEPFTRGDGTVADVRMMHGFVRADVQYAAFGGNGEFFVTPMEVPVDEASAPQTYPDDEGFQMLQIPYKGGALAMVFLLPRTAEGLPALEAAITPATLSGWLGRLAGRAVETTVPRFSVESSAELSTTLKALGMRRAFVNPELPNSAEFPGMNPSEHPAARLFVAAVMHKAWIEVSERGTEAAAATAVLMAPGRAVSEPPKMKPFIPAFRADRPFVFLIRDTRSGAILFLGRMTSP